MTDTQLEGSTCADDVNPFVVQQFSLPDVWVPHLTSGTSCARWPANVSPVRRTDVDAPS
jgi:hypothetical protein